MDFDKYLTNLTYNKYFSSVFQRHPSPVTNYGKQNAMLGSGFKMFLILDSHQSSVFDFEPGNFEIAVNQKEDVVSMLGSSFTANTGLHTEVKLGSIINYTATENFANQATDVRGCLFPDEFSLNLFTTEFPESFKSSTFSSSS